MAVEEGRECLRYALRQKIDFVEEGNAEEAPRIRTCVRDNVYLKKTL